MPFNGGWIQGTDGYTSYRKLWMKLIIQAWNSSNLRRIQNIAWCRHINAVINSLQSFCMNSHLVISVMIYKTCNVNVRLSFPLPQGSKTFDLNLTWYYLKSFSLFTKFVWVIARGKKWNESLVPEQHLHVLLTHWYLLMYTCVNPLDHHWLS